MPLKKNLATLELDNSSKDVTGLATELASKDLMEDTKSDQPKLPATACPNSKKYFSERHPTLTTKSVVDTNQDLFEELIVDEFSLIFFNSIDDYKVFKVQEDQVLKREREEEEIRRLELAAEESARQVKIKKRGRKSKASLIKLILIRLLFRQRLNESNESCVKKNDERFGKNVDCDEKICS
jgi:hypothetical protein